MSAASYRQFQSEPERGPAPRHEPEQQHALDRPPVPMARGELLVMGFILFCIAMIGLLMIIYLTAFAKLTAAGVRERQVSAEVTQLTEVTTQLAAEIASLRQSELVAASAESIGMIKFTPDRTWRTTVPGEVRALVVSQADSAAGQELVDGRTP